MNTFPYLPGFFGAAGSANNEMYRRFKIKLRKNEEMLEDFMVRARKVTAGARSDSARGQRDGVTSR